MVRVLGTGGKFSKRGVNPVLVEEESKDLPDQLFSEPEELEEVLVVDKKMDEAKIEEGAFSKDSTIAELIDKDPSLAKNLSAQGLGCVGCPMSQFETLEQGALTHGMDPDELIKNLNEDFEEYD